MNCNPLTRRELLTAAAGGLAASMWTSPLAAQWPAPRENTVKDRLWLFGSPTGSTAPHTKRRTVMSPAEGAFYLGIPNIYMNQANAGPEAELGRFEPPFAQYAVALRPFKRVLWGLVGSGGFTTPEERTWSISPRRCRSPFPPCSGSVNLDWKPSSGSKSKG